MSHASLLAAIESLPGKGKPGGGRRARCPVHDDRKPSLSIDIGDEGQLLFHCMAGCRTEDIVTALGGTMADLFPETTRAEPIVILPSVDRKPAKAGEHSFEARTPDGRIVAHHHRRDDGNGDKTIWWEPTGVKPSELALYLSWRLKDGPVVVAEGERAALAICGAKLQGVGTYGASTPPGPAALEALRGRRVVLWPDNDDAGRKHMETLADALVDVASEVLFVDVPASAPKGWDAADAISTTIADLVHTARPRTNSRTRVDAADLLELDLPPLRMVIPNLLPEGTTVLASPPKVGKSCLVYQMCVEIALGGSLFGHEVEGGSVLYLALEDGQRRGQARLRAALAGRKMPRGRLEVQWAAPTIGNGLEESIEAWLKAHPDAAMVAIDTLQKVRKGATGSRNAYEVDVEDLGRLQTLFRDRSVALLIVHHSRKETGDDFLASVSGTYGITGSADTIMVIRRKRLEAFGNIVVTGREIAETDIPVRFDDMLWAEAPGAVAEASVQRREVYKVIEESGPLFPQAIATRLDLTRQSVQNMCTKMAAEGAIYLTAKGYLIFQRGITILGDETSETSSHAQGGVSDVSNGAANHSEPPYVPDVSDVSVGDGGTETLETPGTHAHARARTGWCIDFVAHQSSHHRVGSGWSCELCSAARTSA